MSSANLLNALVIASPCPASWAGMTGDDRIRHCEMCDRQVYNIAAMSTEDAAELIRGAEGRVCARLYRRKDGTVLTADCPVGVRKARSRRFRRLAVGGALALVISQVGLALSQRVTVSDRWRRIRDIPVGPSVTLADWKDWALDVCGLAPRPQFTMGAVCIPQIPDEMAGADEF